MQMNARLTSIIGTFRAELHTTRAVDDDGEMVSDRVSVLSEVQETRDDWFAQL